MYVNDVFFSFLRKEKHDSGLSQSPPVHSAFRHPDGNQDSGLLADGCVWILNRVQNTILDKSRFNTYAFLH
jgi:hypothetical protein